MNLRRLGATLLGVVVALLGLSPTSPGPWESGLSAQPLQGRGVVGQEVDPPPTDTAVVSSRVTVLHWTDDAAAAARIAEVMRAFPPLPGLPPELPRGVELYLAPDGPRVAELAGGSAPHWGAGLAIPAWNRIVIPPQPGGRDPSGGDLRTLRHEWAHLGLHQYLEGLRIPRWFDEGYAQWASGGWDAGQGWRLRLAFALGQAPPLDSLTLQWPRDQSSAQLAYLLAGTALEYLVRESGTRGLTLFLERWEEEGSFEVALREVYGLTSTTLETGWQQYVRSRYGWALVATHSMVFWGVLALGMGGLFLIRRRRDQERLEALTASEPPDRPAFWDGEEWLPDGTEGPPPGPGEPTHPGSGRPDALTRIPPPE